MLFFVIFFFNRPRISRGFHFFALECPKIKSKGRAARTAAPCVSVVQLPGLLLTGFAPAG